MSSEKRSIKAKTFESEAALEDDVIFEAGVREEVAQNPADPEVFLDHGRTHSPLGCGFAEEVATLLGRQARDLIHLALLARFAEWRGGPNRWRFRYRQEPWP